MFEGMHGNLRNEAVVEISSDESDIPLAPQKRIRLLSTLEYQFQPKLNLKIALERTFAHLCLFLYDFF